MENSIYTSTVLVVDGYTGIELFSKVFTRKSRSQYVCDKMSKSEMWGIAKTHYEEVISKKYDVKLDTVHRMMKCGVIRCPYTLKIV